MKELSIEQKAKAYDEAKLRMSAAYNSNRCTIGFMNEIFPELKESEDELHRKWILEYLYNGLRKSDEQFKDHFKAAIAWLEAQGEHANFRNKIQIGDKVTRNEDGVLVNLSQLNRVAKKQTEQKLYVNDNAKEMFIKALECVEEQNNKGYKLTNCDKNSWWEDFKAYTSCTIEQKPTAWSEEDEKLFNDLSDTYFYNDEDYPEETYKQMLKRVLDWMNKRAKSLRSQNTWKPSDEQMNALHYVTNFDYGGHKATLMSLYEQLKKLRKE